MSEAIESHVDLNSLPKEERLNRRRHSAAHVLAEAMVELFPDAELGIGPPIDTGFYYDFRLPRSLTPEDLTWLEERMRKSVKGKHAFQMASITKAEAELLKITTKLEKPGYTDKAPAHLVEKDRAQIADLTQKLQRCREQLAKLG